MFSYGIYSRDIGIVHNSNTRPNNTADLFKLHHEAILLLVEEYRKEVANLSTGRISRKKVWQLIPDELIAKSYKVTDPKHHSKFGGLKRTYKSIKNHNGKSGNDTRTWPYFNFLDGLLGVKSYVTPIATASSTGKRYHPGLDFNFSSSASFVSPFRENPKKKNEYL